MLIEHVKNQEEKCYATLVGILGNDGEVYVGWAKCHTKFDNFDKKQGIKIAARRLIANRTSKGPEKSHRRFPDGLRKPAEKFVKRCEKYFKVKSNKIHIIGICQCSKHH